VVSPASATIGISGQQNFSIASNTNNAGNTYTVRFNSACGSATVNVTVNN
jgi:hypothetical protein